MSRARTVTSAAAPDQLKPRAWFELVMPWEEPRWFRGKLRWRRRHERIFWLERNLGLLGIRGYGTPMPWVDDLGDMF
jgi:hypothetical protein